MTTTADQLVSRVKRQCLWPSSNAPLTDAQILEICDELIGGVLWSKIVGSQGDYYVASLDHTLVADYPRYRLPDRMSGPVRDVLLIESGQTEEISIPVIDLEDLGRVDDLPETVSGFHFYVDGDFVGLYPVPDSADAGDTLRIRYLPTPPQLTLSANATTIDTIDLDADDDQFTVVANAASWVTGSVIDIINQGGSHQQLVLSETLSNVSTLTFTTTTSMLGTGIRSGDYVVTAGYSPIARLPDFMVPELILLAASECLQGIEPDRALQLLARASKSSDGSASTVRPRQIAEAKLMMARNSPYRVR